MGKGNLRAICALTSKEATDAVANFFFERFSNGVEIEDSDTAARRALMDRILSRAPAVWSDESLLRGYCAGRDAQQLADDVRGFIDSLTGYGISVGRGLVWIQELPDTNWETAWQEYFHWQRLGQRLVVSPVWEEYEEAPGDVVIKISPGLAFGTGTHPTTALCLEALERLVGPGFVCADAGTGSGILAIACLKLGAARVRACDNDQEAIASAAENARLNGTESRVDLVLVDAGEFLGNYNAQFDLVVANILAPVIAEIAAVAAASLKPGGLFVSSGIIDFKAAEVQSALEEEGFRITEINQKERWVQLTACRE